MVPAVALLCGPAVAARASGFNIVLSVTSGDKQVQTGPTRELPSRHKVKPRRSLTIGRGATARVSWHAENTAKSTDFKDVLVHFVVVKEKQPGQHEVPKLTRGVAYEGALTMDFEPARKATWQFTLNIQDPGSYLVRVETVGMRNKHGHEHYAALELIVK